MEFWPILLTCLIPNFSLYFLTNMVSLENRLSTNIYTVEYGIQDQIVLLQVHRVPTLLICLTWWAYCFVIPLEFVTEMQSPWGISQVVTRIFCLSLWSAAKQTMRKQTAEVEALTSKLADMETLVSSKVLDCFRSTYW